jgi:hypothetical protein
MPQENLELLRRGHEYVAREGQLLPETVHPDLVWDTTTFMSGVGLNLKECIGLNEANRWLGTRVRGLWKSSTKGARSRRARASHLAVCATGLILDRAQRLLDRTQRHPTRAEAHLWANGNS